MNINLDKGNFSLTKNGESIDVFTTLKRIIDSGIIPIPVEGDVQIFADYKCTKLPNGMADQLYARFNTGTGYNEGWMKFEDSDLIVDTPSDEDPGNQYHVTFNIDYQSEYFNEPFTAGQVVMLEAPEAYDVTGCQTTFYKP